VAEDVRRKGVQGPPALPVGERVEIAKGRKKKQALRGKEETKKSVVRIPMKGEQTRRTSLRESSYAERKRKLLLGGGNGHRGRVAISLEISL